jgi:hypothetical protein
MNTVMAAFVAEGDAGRTELAAYGRWSRQGAVRWYSDAIAMHRIQQYARKDRHMNDSTSEGKQPIDPDYEYISSIFGDFVLSEALQLPTEEFDTSEIRGLHTAALEKFRTEGFRSLAFFANGPDYGVRVRLCRKLLQTRIEQGLGIE